MTLSCNQYALIVQTIEKILAQKAARKVLEWPSYGNFGKVTQQPHFLKKERRGDQGKFFKNRPKTSPRLKGPKALWRKLQSTLISMHLQRQDWRRFQREQRLQKSPNDEVMGIFGKSPNTRIFQKEIFQKSPKKQPSFERHRSTLAQMALSSNQYAPQGQRLEKILGQFLKQFLKKCKGETKEIFQKSPKKITSLKRPKSTLAQMALSFKQYALKVQRLEKILVQTAGPKVPEWPSYGNFRQVTQNPHFRKKCKGGTKRNVLKNRPKSTPRFKGPRAPWRKCHYPLICIHLYCKDWRRFQRTRPL